MRINSSGQRKTAFKVVELELTEDKEPALVLHLMNFARIGRSASLPCSLKDALKIDHPKMNSRC